MKKLAAFLAAVTCCACVTTQPPAPKPPAPPAAAEAVFCLAPTVMSDGKPVVGAAVDAGGVSATTDANGYAYLMNVPAGRPVLTVSAPGFKTYADPYYVNSWNCDLPVALTPSVPPLPPTKSRDEITGMSLTFQGLTVTTEQFGTIPWFEPAVFGLTPADRQRVYVAKHVAGDKHLILSYDHSTGPGYNVWPYSVILGYGFADRPDALRAAVREVVTAGFVPVIFMGGDDGERGYLVAQRDLPGLVAALKAPDHDFNQDVMIVPGWDGVFYGWTPEHICDFGRQFRSLSPYYLGIEFSSGHIPTGEGDRDYTGDGCMKNYDALIAEFDYPDGRTGGGNDTVWQILGRLLGPDYRRGPDQPAGDDPTPPSYLREGTPRGPIAVSCFEWVGEYYFVRGQQSAADQARYRAYFRDRGCKFTG